MSARRGRCERRLRAVGEGGDRRVLHGDVCAEPIMGEPGGRPRCRDVHRVEIMPGKPTVRCRVRRPAVLRSLLPVALHVRNLTRAVRSAP